MYTCILVSDTVTVSSHSLYNNDIRDEGAAVLSEGLKNAGKLEVLEYVIYYIVTDMSCNITDISNRCMYRGHVSCVTLLLSGNRYTA